MYEEEYSTRGTTAQIKVEGDKVSWTCYYDGQTMSGSVPLDEHGQDAGLARARKAVDAVTQGVDNPLPPQTGETLPASEPAGSKVVITPGTGNEPLNTDVPVVDTAKTKK